MKASAQIKSLEKKRAELLLRQHELLEGRRKLLVRQSLLTAWCEALTLLQEQQPQSPAAADVQEHFQQLLNEEIALLGELTLSEQLSSCSIDASTALPDPGLPDTLSPGDPMAYLKNCLARGPPPGAETVTSLDMATMLRETVLQSSLHLTLQQAGIQDQSLPTAKELWDRYLHLLVSVIVLGRRHVIEGLTCYNLATLEAEPENAAAMGQRAASLPPLLGLTAQQMDIISAGVETCNGLLAQIHKQRQEIMGQLEAAAAASEAAGIAQQPSACSGASQGPGAGQSSSDLRPLDTVQQRQQHLETQQQLAARLMLVMAKQYMLNLTLGGLMQGCLTYEQATQGAILAWPYAVRLGVLAWDIWRFRQQQLEQQRKHGRQKQQHADAKPQ